MRPVRPSAEGSADVSAERAVLPRHVAIIMDGNGRWATRRGLPRAAGHAAGAEAVRPIVTRCAQLGLDALTLYSFSTENWARNADEVDALMSLYVQYLVSERPLFLENNVRLVQIGRRDGLPPAVLDELDRSVELTAHHTGLTLNLAINYGSRAEITDAVRALCRDAADGRLDPAEVDEALISQRLYTAGQPDPDLLIRTAGEMRLSNYLLWQISYAELFVADVCWPDFNAPQLEAAFEAYRLRRRKFGAVAEEIAPVSTDSA
ncbi:MAG: isoprenyl transferase [Planctomycetota bacterium]